MKNVWMFSISISADLNNKRRKGKDLDLLEPYLLNHLKVMFTLYLVEPPMIGTAVAVPTGLTMMLKSQQNTVQLSTESNKRKTSFHPN